MICVQYHWIIVDNRVQDGVAIGGQYLDLL